MSRATFSHVTTDSGLSRLRFWILTSRRGTSVIAGAVAFLFLLSKGAATQFLYDASYYWLGNVVVANGHFPYVIDLLDERSALSVFVYLPAALLTRIFGSSLAGLFVLVENAALIALLGAIVFPFLVRMLVPLRRIHIWVSAGLCVLLLSGFAPYPLMDLWAVALMFAGIALINLPKRWSLIVGGLCLGLAVGLRPAYFVPAILVLVIWTVFHWRKLIWPVIGFAVAFIPQTIVNVIYARQWLPWPVDQFVIAKVQSEFGGYVVRYDTLAYSGGANPIPQQFFCSPHMSSVIASQSHQPASVNDLANTFFNYPLPSLLLIVKKLGASLFWSADTPYSARPGGFDVLTFEIVIVCCIGLLAMFAGLLRAFNRSSSVTWTVMGLWLGSVATIAFSTPETRFALPLVFVGILGILCLIPDKGFLLTKSSKYWALASLLLIIFLLVAGSVGLSHPAIPGPVNAAICATR